MSLAHSPSIVTNGLVLAYDMNNTGRSWMGAPTTNVLVDTNDLSTGNWAYTLFGNWPATGATANAASDPNGQLTATKVNASGYSRFQRYAVSANVTYTFSLWVRNISMTASVALRIATGLNGTLVAYSYATYISLSSDWARYSVSVTIPASGVNQIEVGIDVSSNYPNSNVYLHVWKPQLEVQSFATPFVSGTRSNARALLDLTGQNTLTASSLTYVSDNTFSLNGTGDYISCGNLGAWFSQGTVSFWMYSTAVENYRNPFTTHYVGGNTGLRFEQNSAGTFGAVYGNDAGTYNGFSFLASGLQANTWYHVTSTWNTGTNTVIGYLNGVEKFNSANTYWATTMPSVTFGNGFSGTRYFTGKLPNAQIYNRVLTATEVAQNFQAIRGRYGV